MNLIQAGLFDHELYGVSSESAVSDVSGKHLFMLKLSYLEDGLYDELDRYDDTDTREEKLVSYRYYAEEYNANVKLTAGEFLYGDVGTSISFERYFSDFSVSFDLARTDHDLQGTNNIARLSLYISIGPTRRYRRWGCEL